MLAEALADLAFVAASKAQYEAAARLADEAGRGCWEGMPGQTCHPELCSRSVGERRTVENCDVSDPEEINNWRRLDERVTTSGQPTAEQLAAIATLGVRHVINLGLHTQNARCRTSAAMSASWGMTYVHIPVDFASPTEADFAAFCSAFEATAEAKVHVHCIFNWRVSAFFYRYRRRMYSGWTRFGARGYGPYMGADRSVGGVHRARVGC